MQLFGSRFGQRLRTQRQATNLLAFPGAQRAFFLIPLYGGLLGNHRRQLCRQRLNLHRQRQQDAGIGAVMSLQQAGNDQPWRTR
ncbi:hypothetical protein D3C78_891640 [compost metagenome]